MIVDANVHASLDGAWFGTGHDATLERLLGDMDGAGVDAAVLTGLPGQVPTSAVLSLCGRAPYRLFPVGAFDPCAHASPREVCTAARRELRGRGLLGVKLHPRLGRYDVLDDRVLALLDEVAGWEEPFAVWICTFLHVPGMRPRLGPVEALCEIVGRTPELPFVLLHGGGPDLLRLATAVRSASNAFLDLSYTITRFRNTSVQLDLEHLLTNFESRLVFGSDFPEADISTARSVLEDLAGRANPAAIPGVLGENLCRAIKLRAP
jgi:predicted TIM-barrel fold metal-dependent hydrolase